MSWTMQPQICEAEDVLEASVEKFPREAWSAGALEKEYYLTGNTAELLSLYSGALGQRRLNRVVVSQLSVVGYQLIVPQLITNSQ